MTTPTVHILMAVYNGAAHLPEQLASFAAQDHRAWHLWASVDASGDGSADVIATFGQTHPVTLQDGPALGAAANFISLCRSAPAGDVWAFSDQDDIWLDHRISRALDQLRSVPEATPALYCTGSWIVDETLEQRRLSRPLRKPPSFANALVQNIAGGNTMVLNGAATRLLAQAAARVGDVVVHDWWIYQIISGAGGKVIYDATPSLLYRQHSGNVIGANDDWRARVARLTLIGDGTWSGWLSTNIAALNATRDLLHPDNQRLLDRFAQARSRSPATARLAALRACGIYRQTRVAEAAMWVAAALGRL